MRRRTPVNDTSFSLFTTANSTLSVHMLFLETLWPKEREREQIFSRRCPRHGKSSSGPPIPRIARRAREFDEKIIGRRLSRQVPFLTFFLLFPAIWTISSSSSSFARLYTRSFSFTRASIKCSQSASSPDSGRRRGWAIKELSTQPNEKIMAARECTPLVWLRSPWDSIAERERVHFGEADLANYRWIAG